MKKLIVTFSILFVIFIVARVEFEFFVDAVPAFAPLLTPLVWLIVAAGLLVLVFSGIAVYKEIKDVKRKPPKGDE